MDLDHIAPRYINELAWWEYEEYVKRLNERIERENKAHNDANKQQGGTPNYKIPNFDSMMNKIGNYKP